MLAINGIGLKKFDAYGEAFLDVIRLQTSDQPSHLISFELYDSGLPIELIAKTRQIKEDTVASYLFKAYQEGHSLNWDDFFDDEIEETVLEAYEWFDEPQLKQ